MWSNNNGTDGIHWGKWEDACHSKQEGGPGIWPLRKMDVLLLGPSGTGGFNGSTVFGQMQSRRKVRLIIWPGGVRREYCSRVWVAGNLC